MVIFLKEKIDQMKQIDGLMNDFHRHGNVQSGVDQTNYTSNPFKININQE